MARMLSFDYASDDNVLDIKDQFMFGDFLVCPVTSPNATSRKVYLPKGTRWHNYFTSEVFDGGQWIDAPCALESTNSFPLFVREGAIIPTTEVAEYSDAQKNQPVTINIFRSKDKTYNIQDKTYNIYEDEGDNYNFENGAYSLIPLSWNEKKSTLTIGTRTGSFPGMQTERTFTVSTSDGKQKTVKYKGKKLTVKL